jgi:uncharacterized protein (DUF1330 family)
MTAYVISHVEIVDQNTIDDYRALAKQSAEKFGGRYLVRGGDLKVVEGDWNLKRQVVVIEFPNMDLAQTWYRSPEYSAALKIRATALDRTLLFVEGATP